MKIIALRMYRFGSVITEQEYRFPQEPGLYFMRGINHAEPRLGSNGAGKSTLFTALCWVLYGKTPRGLKAGDVANWEEGKGSWVELTIELSGQRWIMKRQWSPNRWELSSPFDLQQKIDLTKDATNPVLASLRLEFLPFLNCVLMAQREPMFLDMKPEPKAALFADVMGLDRWIELSGRAGKKASSQDSETRSLEQQVAELTGQLNAHAGNDTQLALNEWESKRKSRIKEIEDRYRAMLPEVIKAKDKLADEKKLAIVAREAWKIALDNSDASDKACGAFSSKVEAKRTELAVQDDRSDGLERAKKEIEGSPFCPTCKRPFDESERAYKLATASQAWMHSVATGKDLYGRFKALESELVRMKESARKARAHAGELATRSEDAERVARDARRALEQLEKDLDRMEDDVAAITKEINPFVAVLRAEQIDREELSHALELARSELNASVERTSMLNMWVKGFKEIRLGLISEALEQLEIEVNSSMTELGLIGWEQLFEVDRENKSGSLTRGFSVRILSPHNSRAVPWEAWSGGESQRLRLAAQMGLADLIRERTGATLALEVWDEPTEGITDDGITDLLDCLKSRALSEHRIIFVVDHRSLGYGGFDGTITVIKTRSGSRFESV